MRYVTKGKSGTVYIDLPRRPSGAGTAVVYSPLGATLQATPTVTLDAVNTTLSGAATAGAATLSLASASSVAVGRTYLVGGAETAGGEPVIVAALSGTTATLANRLTTAKASGATFQGVRVSVAITTASTANAERGCRVEWTDPDTSDVVTIPFDVARFSPVSLLTVARLRALDPQFMTRVTEGVWLPGMVSEAWDILTDALAEKGRVPGGFAGTIDLTLAHAYLVRALVAEAGGRSDADRAYLDDMRNRYRQELDATLAGLPYDPDATGSTAPGAGVWRGFPLVRG